jgi:hypothetical protein
MTLGTEWTTVDHVKQLIAEPYPEDADIEAAITEASGALSSAFCVTPADVDPEDTFPDDWNVRQATAILAAQWLMAGPMDSGDDDNIESESIGGYSYRTRGNRTKATALRIDGVVEELVAGYLCGGAGSGQGVYELDIYAGSDSEGKSTLVDAWWDA